MKIKELIAILQQFDGESDVTVFREYYHGIDEIEFDQVPAIFADARGDCLIIPQAEKWHAETQMQLDTSNLWRKDEPFYVEMKDAQK